MSCIFIAENANEQLKAYFKSNGYTLIEIKKTDSVYEAVSCHTDIYLCKIGNSIVISQEQLEKIKDMLYHHHISYLAGTDPLGYKYPENIKYNGVQIGEYFIHNTKYTDAKIVETAELHGLKIINVKQGYSKCNIAVIDDNSAITSDKGLYRSLTEHGIDVLLIQQGHIKLKGFDYGFIGGASGKIKDSIVFNGNLEEHPDFNKIQGFIRNKGLDLVYFSQYSLEDIGSIITAGEDEQ